MEDVNISSLTGQSVRALQALCEQRGIPSAGRKADLIERLVVHKEGLGHTGERVAHPVPQASVRPHQCHQPQPQPQPPRRGKREPQQWLAPRPRG